MSQKRDTGDTHNIVGENVDIRGKDDKTLDGLDEDKIDLAEAVGRFV